MLRAACIVSLIIWAAEVRAYPSYYVNSASRCWVPVSEVEQPDHTVSSSSFFLFFCFFG